VGRVPASFSLQVHIISGPCCTRGSAIGLSYRRLRSAGDGGHFEMKEAAS
jgi:hypothetical protein